MDSAHKCPACSEVISGKNLLRKWQKNRAGEGHIYIARCPSCRTKLIVRVESLFVDFDIIGRVQA